MWHTFSDTLFWHFIWHLFWHSLWHGHYQAMSHPTAPTKRILSVIPSWRRSRAYCIGYENAQPTSHPPPEKMIKGRNYLQQQAWYVEWQLVSPVETSWSPTCPTSPKGNRAPPRIYTREYQASPIFSNTRRCLPVTPNPYRKRPRTLPHFLILFLINGKKYLFSCQMVSWLCSL